jgi:hypothetical protein
MMHLFTRYIDLLWEIFLVVVFVPGRLSCKFHGGYHGDVVVLVSCFGQVTIGHNTGRALLFFLIIVFFVLDLVLDGSQVIALKRSYRDDCSRSCFYYKNIILVCCFPLLLLLFRASHR